MIKKFFLALSFTILSISLALASNVEELGNYSMKLSVKTTASKESIWQLWEEVENWKSFDERLEYSYLIGEEAKFEAGVSGYLKGQGAPKTPFVITEMISGTSFTEVLKLPLWQTIHLKRYFEKSDKDETIFTHEVVFRGGLKSLYYCLLSGPFKEDLTKVMGKMKQLAEQSESEAKE